MKRFTILLIAVSIAAICQAGEPQRGYRGFLEWDNALANMDYFSCGDGVTRRDLNWYTGISTTHGYQINRHLYAGVGLMLSLANPSLDLMLPIFADIRYDYAKGKFTPFADVRLGRNFAINGTYFSTAVGYRLSISRKSNINVGLGVTLRDEKVEKTKVYWFPVNGGEEYEYHVLRLGTKHDVNPLFTLRIGFDF